MSGLFSWSGSSMYPGKAKEVIFYSMPCRAKLADLLRLMCMFSFQPLEGAVAQIKRESHCQIHLGK